MQKYAYACACVCVCPHVYQHVPVNEAKQNLTPMHMQIIVYNLSLCKLKSSSTRIHKVKKKTDSLDKQIHYII